MNAQTHSPLSLGLILLCAGMVVVMAIPFYLRSSLNKTVPIPPEEKRSRFSVKSAIQVVLLLFVLTLQLLGIARTYAPAQWWMAGALILFALLYIPWKKRNGSAPEDSV